jgi:hypothetical protein
MAVFFAKMACQFVYHPTLFGNGEASINYSTFPALKFMPGQDISQPSPVQRQ